MACVLIGEQQTQESVRLFCLIIHPIFVLLGEFAYVGFGDSSCMRKAWYRRGVMVLEKRISAGESNDSVPMPFSDNEEAMEEFELY